MKRHLLFPIALAGAACFGIGQALAEPKPYEPVIVKHDTAGADDADLKALIDSLQKAVDAGDIGTIKAAIAPDLDIYTPIIGFPDATPPKALGNPDKRPGLQRLDDATLMTGSPNVDYSREDLDGLIIDLFGTALEPATIGKSKIAKGALCAPAEPVFDRDKALAVAAAADVPPGNLWILSEKTDFREKTDPKSPVVGTLEANTIVPFVEGQVEQPTSEDGEEDWYSVALPDGKVAYGADDSSLSFEAQSICFGKVDDKWAVTAVIIPGL